MMTEADSEESAFLFFKHSVTRFTSEGTEQIILTVFQRKKRMISLEIFKTDRVHFSFF